MGESILADLFVGGGVIGLLVLILDIVAIVSVLGGSGTSGHKLLWVVVIILLPVLGMILYFLIGKNSVDA